MADAQSFDYIVVGAGAAGCTIASRLTANPEIRVLLLEAGDLDTDPRIAEPGDLVQLWGSDLDWKLQTEVQPGLNGRRIVITQGKVIGGSTALHAIMWVRGNRRNFDEWQAQGAKGWSYDEILPYFKKSENYEGGASEYHGAGGPLTIRDCPDPHSRSEAFMAAATELGYQGPFWDTNGERQENGAGLIQFTMTEDGKRASASEVYLRPVRDRSNLTIRERALVGRVIFEGQRAVGVEYEHDGQLQQVRAEREVILRRLEEITFPFQLLLQ